MRYLHALRPPSVHFDLKPANVLISADYVGKLSDVGGAKLCALTNCCREHDAAPQSCATMLLLVLRPMSTRST
eukprot:1746896-Prymnesium_polylepis.1